MLSGNPNRATNFDIMSHYPWAIIDTEGFDCSPMQGDSTSQTTISARAWHANNTKDTIHLSALNFKILSTRFVGINAYQLPLVMLTGGSTVALKATVGATVTTALTSTADELEIEIEGDIRAVLTKQTYNDRYSLIITATTDNNDAIDRVIGTIKFIADGVVQESVLTVKQVSAITLDRSSVLLPGKVGGTNSFTVISDFEYEVETNSSLFTVTKGEDGIVNVTATADNNSESQISLGSISVYLKDIPESKVSIDVYQRIAVAPQTIIVYFLGTTLGTYFKTNLTKTLSALDENIQGNSRIIVIQTTSSSNGSLYELRYDPLLGYAVQEHIKYLNFTVPYTASLFEQNIREAIEFAEAEKYALIIGSHGKGWIPKEPTQSTSRNARLMGVDLNTLWTPYEGALPTRHIGDSAPVQYDIEEMADGIEATNKKFDYILFDACFMGNIESAYALRNATKHIIASPCEIMATGFPYEKVVPHMLKDGGKTYDLDAICKTFFEYYDQDAVTRSGCIAVTNTAELESLAAAMKRVFSAEVNSTFSLNSVQSYEGLGTHIFYDLEDIVEQSCSDSSAIEAFKAQLNKAVTSRYHTPEFYSTYNGYNKINHYCGVTTSAYVSLYATDWQNTEWYKATH